MTKKVWSSKISEFLVLVLKKALFTSLEDENKNCSKHFERQLCLWDTQVVWGVCGSDGCVVWFVESQSN